MEKMNQIEKFDGKDFHVHGKIQIQLLLVEKDLWDIVDGGSVAPTDVDALQKWKVKDKKALAIIGLGLSKPYLHHVDFKKSSNEIWEALNQLFGSKTDNAEINMKQKLYGLKMEEGGDIVSHISKFRSLMAQLDGINEKVKPNDAKAILLNSMPKSMSNMVFTLSKLNPSLESIIATLLDTESKDDEEEEAALASQS
ncbi:hypothetical protein KI387_025185, partial [Taxus chinensis]